MYFLGVKKSRALPHVPVWAQVASPSVERITSLVISCTRGPSAFRVSSTWSETCHFDSPLYA